MIRLTGFGPFGDVADNPSSALVLAVAGRVVAGHRIESRVLPVRWRGGLDGALRGATPILLLGFGVAVDRLAVTVETLGTAQRRKADALGQPPVPASFDHPVPSTVDVARLCEAFGATPSDDAGTYLCNAWAHTVVSHAPCPAAFVHLPPDGMAPDHLLRGLRAYLA